MKNDVIKAQLTDIVDLSTVSVANVFTYAVVHTVTQAASCADWTSYRSLYQEFRVLGETIEFLPKFANNQFNTNNAGAVVLATDRRVAPIFFMPYHGDPTAIANITSAVNHLPHVYGPPDQRLRASVRMLEADEAVWSATTASATFPIFGIKTYFEGSTNGATDTVYWGTIHRTWTLQFRGRVDVSTQLAKLRLSAAPAQGGGGADEVKEDYIDVEDSPKAGKAGGKIVVYEGSTPNGAPAAVSDRGPPPLLLAPVSKFCPSASVVCPNPRSLPQPPAGRALRG